MKSSQHAIEMIKQYWLETDQEAIKDRVKIIDHALNKCVKVKLSQIKWDMLVTMVYGSKQSYGLNEKDELIRRLNSSEDMIPKKLSLGLRKRGNKWEEIWLS